MKVIKLSSSPQILAKQKGWQQVFLLAHQFLKLTLPDDSDRLP